MTDLKPCPCCGHKLTWNDVVELDEEGCPAVHFPDVITVLLNCDCGFNMIIPADLIDYPMSGWEDRFKERANKRVDVPKKICANCKHWEVGYDGLGDCSKSSLGIVYYKESCDKWESI